MKKIYLIAIVLFPFLFFSCKPQAVRPEYALVIHGGAGVIEKDKMSPEQQQQYADKLNEALNAGEKVLKDGGAALDAVQASIMVMEDSPLFNAGKGAVFNELGKNEMDASIMDGRTLKAGAVAAVHTIKNPILAARKVMTDSKHVMLIDGGAEKFAAEHGLQMEDSSYFFVQSRYDAYLRSREHGTVGAVALDMEGNLAAGTSTGGMTNKMWGRVGDSPIIGAGTYADNKTCGVSCTGHGEYFIRNVVAYDISARMAYKGQTLQQACDEVIMHKLKDMGAEGGLIALDKDGNISMTFNSPGMFRGYAKAGGERNVAMFGK